MSRTALCLQGLFFLQGFLFSPVDNPGLAQRVLFHSQRRGLTCPYQHYRLISFFPIHLPLDYNRTSSRSPETTRER